MASRDEIRKSDFLKVTTKTGVITNVIAPNGLQVGLDDPEFQSSLTVKGNATVDKILSAPIISGSLTALTDGTPYLQAGSNVTITTNDNGSMTIAASASPTSNTLSSGNGITSFSFNGGSNASVSVDLASTRALSFTSGELQVDFTAVTTPSHTATTADTILVGARGGTDFGITTISSILALVQTTPTALSYPLESGWGLGFKDDIAYSNTNKSNVLGVLAVANGGLASGSLGVKIDPANLSSVTVGTNDRVLVGQNSIAGVPIGYATAQSIANLATVGVLNNALTVDTTGLDLSQGTTFDGSSALTISAKTDGLTISGGGSGLNVLKVPNTLTDGNGVATFSYDGSSTTAIAIDLATSSGLNFSSTELLLDVENLTAGGTPAKTDELAISFGSLTTRKVNLESIQTLFNTGPVVIAGMLQVTGSIEATGYVMGKSGLSGSLTRLVDGTSYLKAGSNITITSESNGQVIIAARGTGDSSGFFNSPASGFLNTTGSTTFAGTLGSSYKTSDVGSDVIFFVSGSKDSKDSSIAGTVVFGGDTVVSGTIVAAQNISGSIIRASSGFSGSLTTLADGNPYLIAGTNITMATGSSGAITIAAVAGASLDVISGSTTVSTIDSIDVSKLGIMQDLGSGDIAITGSIGVPEDGSYDDGLFIDFTDATPVGTAVDRFNEVLKGLAPTAAPNLDDMNCSDSGDTAELSFGSSQSISGYANAQPSTLTPTDNLSDVDINGTYTSTISSNDARVACFAGSTTIDGTLNADVSADGVNYDADSFGDGDQGTLKLFVNDNSTEIHSVDLSSFGSGTSLNGNGSGFILSATTPGHFSDGSNFATFQHRQGTYLIHPTDQRNGWNYVRVVHAVGGTDRTCNYAEWVNDSTGAAVAMSISGDSLSSLSMTGTKNLSGVKYNTGGSAVYAITIANAYRNVYSSNQITFGGSNTTVSAQNIPVINHGGGEDETKSIALSGLTATISGDPILDGSISVNTNVPAPLKSNLSNVGSQSISGILLYDLSDTSSSTSETFRGESYRLISGSYAAQADVSAGGNVWNSTTSLLTVDGLMFYNSRLYAPIQGGPSGDFRNTSDGGSITNGPSSNVNYSSVTTGTRTFFRYITNTSGGSQTNFSLTINGSGTIVSQGTSLSTGNISVLLKLPTTSAAFSTGWMDLALAFATGQTGNGNGCLNGSFDSSLNATNGATFGTQSAGNGEFIMIKIETDAAFTGYISSLSVTWG